MKFVKQNYIFFLVVSGFFFSACSASKASDLQNLQDKIVELTQAQSKSAKEIEGLGNRLFLLEDKVDTSRVAIERRTNKPLHLPVVRIKPEDNENETNTSKELVVKAQGRGDSVIANSDVQYSGAALVKEDKRPVLRLSNIGTQSANGTSKTKTLDGLDPNSIQEKLPVVPLASRKRAQTIVKRNQAMTGPMRAYKRALKLYHDGQLDAASLSFKTFLKKYKTHAYADNAQYWLGECYYDQKQYRAALNTFRKVVEDYPNGNKAPAALLKMGFSYMRLSEKNNARTVLAQVVEIFPRSGVAKIASKELTKLR